ncbi:acetyltransferase [Hyalangium rubrum]|uniref:Acetyltransferase n=1 Tax=Hyalangium rubrum TaxID=3103134 RepID=A0ABU5HGB6_9BACT|nr:acetyltransferase [Hyalangium sp. s54d21]MDY7231883.1 acetyltransferase [Hyalangium sp. s54d21]
MQGLFLYGSGGHASVVADLVRANGQYAILGLIDDDPLLAGGERFGHRVLGDRHALTSERTDNLFLGIGDNHTRQRLSAQLAGWRFPTLIHPTAVIGENVSIGAGTAVMPFAVIEHGATIGEHCIINNGAVIGHGSRIGAYCHVSGKSALGGGVTLEPFVFVGMGAVVTPGVTVAKNCLLSAGSMTSRDIGEGATVVGNPGRPFFNRRGMG